MFDDGNYYSDAIESEEEKMPNLQQDEEMIDLELKEDEPMSQMIETQT
jgi:hypothetical protein